MNEEADAVCVVRVEGGRVKAEALVRMYHGSLKNDDEEGSVQEELGEMVSQWHYLRDDGLFKVLCIGCARRGVTTYVDPTSQVVSGRGELVSVTRDLCQACKEVPETLLKTSSSFPYQPLLFGQDVD